MDMGIHSPHSRLPRLLLHLLGPWSTFPNKIVCSFTVPPWALRPWSRNHLALLLGQNGMANTEHFVVTFLSSPVCYHLFCLSLAQGKRKLNFLNIRVKDSFLRILSTHPGQKKNPYPSARLPLMPHWLKWGHVTTSEPIAGGGCHNWFKLLNTYPWTESRITSPRTGC